MRAPDPWLVQRAFPPLAFHLGGRPLRDADRTAGNGDPLAATRHRTRRPDLPWRVEQFRLDTYYTELVRLGAPGAHLLVRLPGSTRLSDGCLSPLYVIARLQPDARRHTHPFAGPDLPGSAQPPLADARDLGDSYCAHGA